MTKQERRKAIIQAGRAYRDGYITIHEYNQRYMQAWHRYVTAQGIV